MMVNPDPSAIRGGYAERLSRSKPSHFPSVLFCRDTHSLTFLIVNKTRLVIGNMQIMLNLRNANIFLDGFRGLHSSNMDVLKSVGIFIVCL